MDLTGKLLIAMPGMEDPRFEHSVVVMCAHSEDGAMGLIVNKPVPEPDLGGLFDQIGIPLAEGVRRGDPILFGGPVETGRGFVLHTADWFAATMTVGEGLAMTATRDILEEMGAGRGPAHATLMLGYAGWGPGQLEQEILANGWLTTDANPELALDSDHATKWTRALGLMGIDPRTLSAAAGHA
ncbi:hypothetical protein CKO11_01825 [Rhodobacter sp. TJ_12]|uniref:YqgE/AlgH family protein n=1 Tax=Rhodobacter sp. TJ_12 TaxID=2029399 RepID=UPI001CBED996|nr:YqgE/AlgH family protein [Rhodobacter sp. TJ_12]MBZ4021202.1 hypothetical protein [Rhodobacter sp. TJ_12]